MQSTPLKPDSEERAMPTRVVDHNREAIYERAAQEFGQPPESPKQDTPPAEDKKVDDKPATPPAEPSAGAELDTSGDKKPDDKKYVPLPALQEERERRKELAAEMRELKRQQDLLLEDNRKLMEVLSAGSKREETPDYSDPDDIVKEVISLRKKVEDQAKTINEFKGSYDAGEQKRVAESYETLAKKAADELSAEGYPGFLDITEAVAKDLKAEFDETEDKTVFTPDGWKRVYKEKTYPRIFGKVVQTAVEKAKADKIKEKEELKEKAKLHGSPGTPSETEKSQDDAPLTQEERYKQYMAMRKASSVFRSNR